MENVKRRLGRVVMPYDARDWRMRDFMSMLDHARAATVTAQLWTLDAILDQGDTPHCVGFGWADWGNCLPVNDHFVTADGHALYYECKIIDGEPNAEDGSDTRSGAKAMQQRGRLQNYAFAQSVKDVEAWLLSKGPVVTGTNWYDGMFEPDRNGFVKPTGWLAGGHEYLMIGADSKAQVFTFANSWGPDWGVNGTFKMSYADYQRLFNRQGDACVAVELPLTPPPPPTPDPSPVPTPAAWMIQIVAPNGDTFNLP